MIKLFAKAIPAVSLQLPLLLRSDAATEGVLKNFTKFAWKDQYQSLFFNKVVGLRSATLLKNRLWQRCFPFPFLKNIPGQLFLFILF